MALKIYVDNLNYHASEEFVRSLFSRHGFVQRIWITRTRVGVPHGYGFVHMSDDTAAERAISLLDGVEFDGRAISVNRARD
jgi:RNA recognition motif-containing protein